MVEFFRRFQERRAISQARREFELWQREHPIEVQILDLLDEEFRHMAALDQPRRVKLYEQARQFRRELGFGDHLVPYVYWPSFRIDELLARDGVVLDEKELELIKQVNHGFLARVGFFTDGIRRAERLYK